MRGLARLACHSDGTLGPGVGLKSGQQTKPGRHHRRRKKGGGGTRSRCEDGNLPPPETHTEKTCSSLGTGINTGAKPNASRAKQAAKEGGESVWEPPFLSV